MQNTSKNLLLCLYHMSYLLCSIQNTICAALTCDGPQPWLVHSNKSQEIQDKPRRP